MRASREKCCTTPGLRAIKAPGENRKGFSCMDLRAFRFPFLPLSFLDDYKESTTLKSLKRGKMLRCMKRAFPHFDHDHDESYSQVDFKRF